MTVEELYMLLGAKEAELYSRHKEIEQLKKQLEETKAKPGGRNDAKG